MQDASRIALATLLLFAPPAYAQIVVDSAGKGAIVIERDKANAANGGDGVVVHVGRMEIHTGDDVLNVSDFERPNADNFSPTDPAGGLSIRLNLANIQSGARADAERIAELTHLVQKLNDAINRQCEPVVAAFGKPCRLIQTGVGGYFRPRFNEGPQIGANANAHFEIALPGVAFRNPN